MKLGGKTLIFKFQYEKNTSWAKISNFITKWNEQRVMVETEVEGVQSLALQTTMRYDGVKYFEYLEDRRDSFREIKTPQKLYDDILQYDIQYYIQVELALLKDEIDLQQLILIKSRVSQPEILVELVGNSESYFRISNYLLNVNIQNKCFYNTVLFKDNTTGIRKRMALKEKKLFRILPWLQIDQVSEQFLRDPLKKHMGQDSLENILAKKEYQPLDNIYLRGIMRCYHTYQNKFVKCSVVEVANKLGNTRVLTVILLAVMLKEKETEFENIKVLSDVIQELDIYTAGCLQLTQNIIMHTKEQVGSISFRILKSNSQYLRNKYNVDIEKTKQYYEIMIADYAAQYEYGNIVQNFLDNIDSEDMKKRFEGLTIEDFFLRTQNSDMTDAWEQYYRNQENIGKHYGLRIFTNMIQKQNGAFKVESHGSHYIQTGEYFGFNVNEEQINEKFVLQGTTYSILLPIRSMMNTNTTYDYALEHSGYEQDVRELAKMKVKSLEIGQFSPRYTTQVKKQEQIQILSNCIVDSIEENKVNILTVNLHGNEMESEILYKAILKAAVNREEMAHIVLFHCSIEFCQEFWDIFVGDCQVNDIGYALKDRIFQIVLYTREHFYEMRIQLNNLSDTYAWNRQINFIRETPWRAKLSYEVSEELRNLPSIGSIPFDILVDVEHQGEKQTLFEHYMKSIVNKNIQGEDFGCKFENTHMRLGSTIHVDNFYEAELLFGNKLFVDKIAMLIVLRLNHADISQKLTLYGYASYSEQLIFRVMYFLKESYGNLNIDYAILERETENKGLNHVDRIRYSEDFHTKQEQIEHFKERKIVCIVPIGATLKTNEKLISLFCEENGQSCRKNIIENFELILVASEKPNSYWQIEGDRIKGKETEIVPSPRFFIKVLLDYQDSLECKWCFPDSVIEEVPLIEVNALSTIPNQSFGQYKTVDTETYLLMDEEKLKEKIFVAERKIEELKEFLLYSHLERGENHFLFYIQTERFFVKCHKEKAFQDWLKDARNKLNISKKEYYIIFAPAHFSNASFVEYINNKVFQNAAIVIRGDIDKEYRSNFVAKHSNVYCALQNLFKLNPNNVIRFFYIDDCIISGRTFWRAESLLQSIVGDIDLGRNLQEKIFDGIFVLIDRNSEESRKQYIGRKRGIKDAKHFFAYCTLSISSLRNHGDSCILCNLEKEAKILQEASVTKSTYIYWKAQEKKFEVESVDEFLKKQELLIPNDTNKLKIKQIRADKRMVCTNNANIFLKDKYYYNHEEIVLKRILKLLLCGCEIHEEEQTEYFISYLKSLSRPFIVFDKEIKNAIFLIMLVMSEYILKKKSITEILNSSANRPYLQMEEISELFGRVTVLLDEKFSNKEVMKDLLVVLLRQLTELKSNYFIRQENINAVILFLDNQSQVNQSKFYKMYCQQVKKLLGISSDTSKSVWFDTLLHEKQELQSEANGQTLNLPKQIQEQLYLENNRVVRDAYAKLRGLNILTEEEKNEFYRNPNDLAQELVKGSDESLFVKLNQLLKSYQFKDYRAILNNYEEYKDKDRILTEEAAKAIYAEILLEEYIEKEFTQMESVSKIRSKELQQRFRTLVIFMNDILRAEETMFMMEVVSECDCWKEELVERYNEAVGKDELLPMQECLAYQQLVCSNSEHEVCRVEDNEVYSFMQECKQSENFKELGYHYSMERKCFVWQLGLEKGDSTYIYARFAESEDRNDYRYLYYIRNLMQLYHKLNEYIFNSHTNIFLYEFIEQVNRKMLHSNFKTYSHTDNDIKLKQYEHLQGGERNEEYYHSDLLMLLADLNVSEHFRNSLKKEYYLKNVEIVLKEWGKNNYIVNGSVHYVTNSDTEAPIKIRIESGKEIFKQDRELTESDTIMCYNVANAEREIFLLLYSLLSNVAIGARGKVENGCVKVFISKTKDGRFRMANIKGKADIDIENLKLRLRNPPEQEEQGISVWSVSRYCQRINAIIIANAINKYKVGDRQNKSMQEQRDLRRLVSQLIGEQYMVEMCRETIGHEEYFSILLPIMSEKYQEFIK